LLIAYSLQPKQPELLNRKQHGGRIIKPHQLSLVAMGLRDILNLTGISIGKGQGFGRGRARGAAHRNIEDEMACITTNAHTSRNGDSKIYITEVIAAVRISNGERGISAV